MAKLICKNPPIEKSIHNMHILAALERAGLATRRRGQELYQVDWKRVMEQKYIKNIGEPSWAKIWNWALTSNPPTHWWDDIKALASLLSGKYCSK